MKKDNVKHYTPQMAREESKAAFNWRDYVQQLSKIDSQCKKKDS